MRHWQASGEAPRLWALFVAGALALHFPLLGVWAYWSERLGGWGAPLAVAAFVAWGTLIGVLAWFMERAPD
jgi:hypothetical protein